MHRTLLKALLLAALAALPLSRALADAPTKDEVVAVVKQAIVFYKANGRAKAMAEFNRKDGQFAKGKDYIDVHDVHGVCVADPKFPEQVGTSRMEQKDVNGTYWIRDIVERTRKGENSGWSRYVRKNPLNGKLQDKLSYWEVYDGLIFKAGLYIE